MAYPYAEYTRADSHSPRPLASSSPPPPPPIPPNPYTSRYDVYPQPPPPPPPPPGAYHPTHPHPNGQRYHDSYAAHPSPPSSPTWPDSTWRESSFISMYGGGSTHESSDAPPPRVPPQSPPRYRVPSGGYYPNGIGNGNTLASASASTSATTTSYASPPHPTTFVSASGAAFTRNPSTSTHSSPAYPAYATARVRSDSYKRPLNPPPVPQEYYYSQPPPTHSQQPTYHDAYDPVTVSESRGGAGTSTRLSNDSSERYSVYSYPGSLESTSTASGPSQYAVGPTTRNDGLPHRKQSLEHLKALSLKGSPSYTDFSDPIPEAAQYLPPRPAPPPRSRQPTILMSPPLDSLPPNSPMSPSSTHSDPYAQYETPRAYARDQAIDSTWNGDGIGSVNGGGRTTSYGSTSNFSHSTTSSSSHPTYASTMQTSPAPSPSLSHSYSFTSEQPQQSNRRPSQATLSPHSSVASPATYRSRDASFSPYPFSSSISPSPSTTSDLQLLHPSPSFSSSLHHAPFGRTGQQQHGGNDEYDDDDTSFLNPAFLSHLATYVKDHVPQGNRTKSSGVVHWGFTGTEIVDTILKALPPVVVIGGGGGGGGVAGAGPTDPSSNSSLMIPSSTTPNPPTGAQGGGGGMGVGPPSPSISGGAPPSSSSSLPSPSPLSPLAPPPPLPSTTTTTDPRRKLALSIARTLQLSLWFHEVDFDHDLVLQDDEGSRRRTGGTVGGGGGGGAHANQIYSFDFGRIADKDDEDDDGRGRGGGAGGGGGGGGGIDHVEIPTGVVTELTRCESLVCTRDNAQGAMIVDPDDGTVLGVRGACYSFDCPNRPQSGLHRVGSTLSNNSAMIEAPLEDAENWASSVPKSILDSLNKQEIAYQNQVFELIHGEQKYYDDLTLIETGFVEPLRASNPPIIQPHRLPHFLQSILLNISDIRRHSATFLGALRAKQAESIVVRGGIGKIVLMSAVEWGTSYIQYTTAFPMADWLFKEEKENNPRFNDLLMDFHKRPEASKRGFDTFHNRATFRGLRYILLLEQILKNAPNETEQDRQDREYLDEAIKVIRQQGKEADAGVGETKGKVSLRELEKTLIRKQGDLHDLELLDESRKFFMSSRVYRRPEGSAFTDQFQEANLVLLDNYLITTKAPRPDRDGKQKYLISRRPVPLDLIQLKASSFSEPPVPRSSGFHLRSNRSAGSPQPSGPSTSSAYAASDASLLYPISFFQMGRFDGLVYLYVDTPSQRLEWERKLKQAVSLRAQRQEANRVVRLEPLADATFGTTSTIGSLNVGPTHGTNQFGKPTCSTPLQTIDGPWLVIAGCQEGIFIGWRGRPQSMQQVVHLAGITQCAVLPDFSFLLVVANKVLVAYALEALIPTKTTNKLDQANKAPQRLSGQKDVSFFRVGKVGDADPRTLVIYAKKSGVKESVFKALEPVSQNDRAKAGSGGHRFLGFGTQRPEWFRVHKEFFMPSLVTSLQFQRSKLALIGSRGVEIMDLESMRTMTVPDFPSVRHNRNFAALAKRCEEVPTLGMFRIADSKFLLVYADFAFHVGRHGEPIEGPFIEWESKPEQIAFCFPYIFAISPTIIEIRNAFTGRLAQFITGSHIHLTFDGSAISSSSSSSQPTTTTAPDPMRPSRGSSLSSTSASIAQSNVEADTPVEKLLHVSMRTGSYHVLYEIVIVA